jgi:hypothetical protein
MADTKIRIGANTQDLKRSILDISRTLQNTLGRSKISILSEDTKRLLKTEMKTQLSAIGQRTQDLTKRAELYTKALKGGVDNVQQEIKYKQRLLQITQQLGRLEGERVQLSTGMSAAGKGGKLGGLAAALGGTKLGGLAAALVGNPVALLAAGAVGAGVWGAAKTRQGFQQYESSISDRIMLRGRGVRDFNLDNRGAGFAALGMTMEDVISQRRQAIDVFGRGGSDPESIRRRGLFERGMGLDMGTMTQFGAGFRGAMGADEAQRAQLKLQAATLASGITDAIGPYLETAANMLTELNKTGFAMDTEALSALNALTRVTGDQSERMGRVLMSVDQSIRGAKGETNAFMQMAAASAGLGGGTMGGLQAVIQEGLFGVDINKMRGIGDMERSALQNLGFGQEGHTGRFVGGILNLLDQQFGTESQLAGMSEAQRNQIVTARGRALNLMGMAPTTAAGIQLVPLLRELQDPTTGKARREEIQRQMKELEGPTPEKQFKNLEDIQKSNAGQLQELKTQTAILLSIAGEKAIPLVKGKRELEQTAISLGLMGADILGTTGKSTGRRGALGLKTTAEHQAEWEAKHSGAGSAELLQSILENLESLNEKQTEQLGPLRDISKNTKNNTKTKPERD